MVKVPPLHGPSSAPAPPHGAPGGSGWLDAPRGETGPLSAQPPSRVLELAASKSAGFTAFDHPGAVPRRQRRRRAARSRPLVPLL